MSQITCNLRQDIIIREEDDDIYMFNKLNSAVVRTSRTAFDEFSKGCVPCTKSFEKAVSALRDNGMLEPEDKLNSLVDNNKESRDTVKGTFRNIFGLRSKLNPFVVLWAITPQCNLSCCYCFPEVHSVHKIAEPLPYESLRKIADQIIQAKIFAVRLSGGEAFLEKRLWDIVEQLCNANILVTILSNGTTVNRTIINNLLKYNVRVGISLDAPNEEINAITRGTGNFVKTVSGIKELLNEGIRLSVLTTVTKYNYTYIFEHLDYLSNLGITNITFQDLRPFASVNDYNKMRLTKEQEESLFKTIPMIEEKYPHISFYFGELLLYPNPNSKLKKTGKIMSCPSGDCTGYIDFFGDFYPCTSLTSMKLGNLLADGDITKLWRSSENIKQLRALKETSLQEIPCCRTCELNVFCDGGCRGDAVFYHGDLYGYPSRCPKLMQLYSSQLEELV